MLWIVFGVLLAALLLAAFWVDHNRKRRGVTRELGPLGRDAGLFGGSGGPAGGDGGGGGGG